jgi:hypothetical protein
MLQDSIIRNIGTRVEQLRPYMADESQTREKYQSICAQTEYSSFSHEELRLADYEHSEELLPNIPIGSSNMTSNLSPQILPRPNSKRHSGCLDLLRGTGIELHVGTTTPLHHLAKNEPCSIWSLPRSLISHYSPFLEAACSRDFKERHENRIELPDDDANVFALFVEWMYYGDYSVAPLSLLPADSVESINVDAKCWVLGDKLLCIDFKNHAMSRLYAQNTAAIFNKVVTPSDVRYVCSNSAVDSKLRELYVALVATHFSNSKRIHGSAKDWDTLILEYPDLRSLLLQSFRMDVKDRCFLKSKKHYLDEKVDLARDGSNP